MTALSWQSGLCTVPVLADIAGADPSPIKSTATGRVAIRRFMSCSLSVAVRQFNAYLLRSVSSTLAVPLIPAVRCQIHAGGAAGVKAGRRPPRRGVVLTLAAGRRSLGDRHG